MSDRLAPIFSQLHVLTPEQLQAMGLSILAPLAEVMVRQMLFMDPPAHGRIRDLASRAFTPRRVEGAARAIFKTSLIRLLDAVQASGHMDVIADLA